MSTETENYGSCSGASAGLASLMGSMPSSQSDLLKMIAAQSLINGAGGVPISQETLAFNNSSVSQLASIPSGAKYALVTPHADDINFRIDGGDPTTGLGHHASDNDNFVVTELANLRIIGQSGSGNLFVTYF